MSKLTQRITSIAKNKEAKTVAGNFMWLSLLQVAGYVFPLITMPYLARVIGVEGFGKIAFAAAVVLWAQIISEWGFNQTATRDVAQNRDDRYKVSEIFSNVLWARTLLSFFVLILLCILILTIPKFRSEWDILLVTFLLVPGHILFPDWFFQAMEKMRYISIINILMKLFFTIMVFIFVKDKNDYILQPLFVSLGYVLSGVTSLYIIINKWHIQLLRPCMKKIFRTIKESTDVFINNLAPNLYNSFSQVLLGLLGDVRANGIYEGGNKFYQICSNLLHVLTRVFFPFLSRKPHKHKLFVMITMSITTLVAILLFVFAPLITKLILSAEFTEAIIVIRILAISLIFSMLYNCYGMCYLIIHKEEKLLRQITIIVSVIGFIIAYPLIKNYSYLGVALTVLISRFLLGVTTFVFAVSKKNKVDYLYVK